MVLEKDQLPLLKSKFSLPTEPNLDKKRLIDQQTDTVTTTTTTVFQTPVAPYHHSISQQSLSFSAEPTPTKKHSTGDLFSGSSTKLSSSTRKQAFLSKVSNSTPSQRESITSLRSNSDEENKSSKYVLDEKVNPKRPLRPKTQTSSNSGSNSTHNSRPSSHISDDGGTQLSLLPRKFDKEELKSCDEVIINHNVINNENTIYNNQTTTTPTPPPKPPKPLNALKKFNIQQNNGNDSPVAAPTVDLSNVKLRKH